MNKSRNGQPPNRYYDMEMRQERTGSGDQDVALTDEEIIQRVQRGDRAAYVELFDRYYPQIHRYARWQMQDVEGASDVASETFVRAFKAVDGFRTNQNTPYLAYLLQICRRLIYAERHRKRRQPSHSLDDPEAQARKLIDSCAPPLESLLDDERRQMIRQSLEQLSPEDREVIVLAFESDLSRRDIAALLGKPSLTAVSSHLHRAMKKLRVLVGRQGYFGVPHDLREAEP